MSDYEQGVIDGRQQILDFLDTFDITELGYRGGVSVENTYRDA